MAAPEISFGVNDFHPPDSEPGSLEDVSAVKPLPLGSNIRWHRPASIIKEDYYPGDLRFQVGGKLVEGFTGPETKVTTYIDLTKNPNLYGMELYGLDRR